MGYNGPSPKEKARRCRDHWNNQALREEQEPEREERKVKKSKFKKHSLNLIKIFIVWFGFEFLFQSLYLGQIARIAGFLACVGVNIALVFWYTKAWHTLWNGGTRTCLAARLYDLIVEEKEPEALLIALNLAIPIGLLFSFALFAGVAVLQMVLLSPFAGEDGKLYVTLAAINLAVGFVTNFIRLDFLRGHKF